MGICRILGKLGCFAASFLVAPPSEGAAVFRSDKGSFDLHIEKVDLQPVKDNAGLLLPKNRMFNMGVRVVPRSSKESAVGKLSFDAQMPEHRHGMNTDAEIEDQGKGSYLVKAVKLHMPGLWLLRFEMKGAGWDDKLDVHWTVK